MNKTTTTYSSEEIIRRIALQFWKRADSTSETPPVTLRDCQNCVDPDAAAKYANCDKIVSRSGKIYELVDKGRFEALFETIKERFISWSPDADELPAKVERPDEETRERLMQESHEHARVQGYTLATVADFRADYEARKNRILSKAEFEVISWYIAATKGEPSDERCRWLFQIWHRSKEQDDTIPNPFLPLVAACLKDHLPIVPPERWTKTGILQISLQDTYPQGTLFEMPPVPDQQLELPSFPKFESELVPSLFLEAYEHAGGRESQPGRGAPIEQRLFVNLLLEYCIASRGRYSVSRMDVPFRDLKGWLYPNGTTAPKSILIPKIREGLNRLNDLHFYWQRVDRGLITAPDLPTLATKPSDELCFIFTFPEGMNTKNGPMIAVEPLRIYGAQSAPKFRAFIRLAYIWDAVKAKGGYKGGRVYATEPEVLRNSDGYLLDEQGAVIQTGELYKAKTGELKFRKGASPQRSWHHPLAVKTGNTTRSRRADRVPVLSDGDMVKLFYDYRERAGDVFRQALANARKLAGEMEAEGRIAIEKKQTSPKTGEQGWRILEPYSD